MATYHECDFCKAQIEVVTGAITISKKGEGRLKKECCKQCFAYISRMIRDASEPKTKTTNVVAMRRKKA